MSAEKMRPTHEAKLDLDALDERALRVIGAGGVAGMFLSLADWSALIQRLREAEYDRDVIAPGIKDDTEDVFEINQRLQARIAQLERVREAAQEVWLHRDRPSVFAALNAALAAVEEK